MNETRRPVRSRRLCHCRGAGQLYPCGGRGRHVAVGVESRHEDFGGAARVRLLSRTTRYRPPKRARHCCARYALRWRTSLLGWMRSALRAEDRDNSGSAVRSAAQLTHDSIFRRADATRITGAPRRSVEAAPTSPAVRVPQRSARWTSGRNSSPAPRFSFLWVGRQKRYLDGCLSW